jgi:hypothetical protein
MTPDRRRYFRLNDTLGLAYRNLSIQSETPKAEAFWQPLAQADAQINQLLGQLAARDPSLAQLLALFNQKLERLASDLVLAGAVAAPRVASTQTVNISACGLAFSQPQALPKGALLALEIQLLPGNDTIAALAEVMACDPCDTGGFYWRLAFTRIEPAASERLIAHLLQRQREQIQAAKQQLN